ncbi:MAG: helix-turn-helix domain-containing protein [Clostridium sp.]|nr:helix-turn-helix domain-containing protein [Clostridium sp.]
MNWIKDLKAHFGLTQQKLSDLTDIPKSTIEAWERGIRKPPEWLPKMIYAYLDTNIKKENSQNTEGNNLL